jgi:hypothetical protein
MTRHRTGISGSANDPVRMYLKSRGVSSELIEGGLEAAIDRWDAISRTAKTYDFTLDDWLNDMDLRDIIEGAMGVGDAAEHDSVSERLKAVDDRLKKGTVETGSIWGSAMSGDLAPDPAKAWWYFRRPSKPGETMREDLETAGLE